jgi:hypothetical protein
LFSICIIGLTIWPLPSYLAGLGIWPPRRWPHDLAAAWLASHVANAICISGLPIW